MTKEQKITAGAVVAILLLLVGIFYFLSPDGGIELEEGKVYEIGFTQLATINGLEGRKFDFKDRSTEPNSKIIPLRDARGALIVIENSQLVPGTLRVFRKTAPARTVEGEKFPAQSWKEYHFNFREKSPQDFIPSFK